jgi:hypothetical protein
VRTVITGVNAEGRSCVLSERDLEPEAVETVDGVSTALLYSTTSSPPPPRPAGNTQFIDVRLAPGLVRWMIVEHAAPGTYEHPSFTGDLHYADALYLVTVQRGTIEMRLEDDVRSLHPGDCVVMPGIDHAYTAGPDGCRLLVFQVGTPPPT